MGLFDIGSMSAEVKEYYDIVIIGAGPAGLTAAIYARRAGLTVLVIEKAIEGGAVTQTHIVENWPGEISIEGQTLGQKFADHAKHFGAEIHYAFAQKVTTEREYKIVEFDNGSTVKCKVLIIATGTEPRKLGVPGESEFRGKGVTYCAACDGYLFKDKDVVVIGGGDSACDESHFLAKIVNSVTMIQNLPYLTAAKVLQERILNDPKIKVVTNHVVKEIRGNKKVEEIVITHNETNEETVIKTDGVFIYVGLLPKTEIVKDVVTMDDYGYIITDENMETSVPGIYAVGDIRIKSLRQIVTATADGAIAVEHAVKKYL
ncbi:MAG TPA: thioredoxin-disulfide reductase [Fervidobacterium sp.]|nr:thioredoxin-disulfide reductase [Fervidobacterium sp.]HPT54869.1 thioredoxin-disulfide reductase [Fervidobacterium sp.]HPZ18664.1 thioredoxin-disulfide reductase [Fervidobacterium sp.]HQE49859.1 thioredoxin-disulfide reductase [Fervidobacterium sp.]HUM44038.1 thioredoxin-disulfide reductase [Fervidobacterium sp.]